MRESKRRTTTAAGRTRPASADNRARQTRGEARREHILNEAVELLAAKGFRGTSVAELAERVGMTHPGLLYYFGTKERLLHDVVAERERMEDATLYGSMPDDLVSLARLPDIARVVIETTVLTRLYVVLAAENFDAGDPLHDFFAARYKRARRLVVHAVKADHARGEVRDGIDADQIAREVVATFMGLEIQWLMDPDHLDYVATIEAYTDGLRARLAP